MSNGIIDIREHTATHNLPISYGYSKINSDVYVTCGICKGYFYVDEEWVERYIESERKRYSRRVYSPLENRYLEPDEIAEILQMIDKEHKDLLNFVILRNKS